MFIVETVYDRATRRIRVHALPGQQALTREGREIEVDPERWVQFPRALRSAEGLRFACETLVLVADGGQRRAYYHAGGDITPLERVGLGDYARGAGAVTHVRVPAGGLGLRPVRRLFHAGSGDTLRAAGATGVDVADRPVRRLYFAPPDGDDQRR